MFTRSKAKENNIDPGIQSRNTGIQESWFLKPSVSRTSRYLQPNLVSLGFASIKLYNFTPDFSNPRFLETPDNSNQFWLPWGKLTLDNSNLGKFPNHLVRMSITFKPLNKLDLDNLRKSIRNVSQIIDQRFLVAKRQQVITNYFNYIEWAPYSDSTRHAFCYVP